MAILDNIDVTVIDTSSFCDADKSIRALSYDIKSVSKSSKFIGIARPIKCHDDFLPVIQKLDQCKKGDVLVVDNSGSGVAIAGEIFTTEAVRRQLAAIVVDGAVRDVSTLKQLSFPVFAKCIHPMAGTTNALIKDEQVICGGVQINEGDIIIGDDDGVIALSETQFKHLLPISNEIQEKEALALEKIKNGESLINLLNVEEHVENLEHGKKSSLKFI